MVFERVPLSNHFVEDFVTFGRNFLGCLFSFAYVFVIFAFEEHAICEEHFDEMECHHEAKVPLEEGEEVTLTLYDLIVSWNDS